MTDSNLNIEEIESLINTDTTEASKHIYNGLKCFARIAPKKGYIDGDTIRVIFHFYGHLVKNKIRLLGINAPESRTTDLEEKALGMKAKKYFEDLCKTNRYDIVYLECGKLDDFGRILAEVYQVYFGESNPQEGTERVGTSHFIHKSKKSLNQQMLEAGHAKTFMA